VYEFEIKKKCLNFETLNIDMHESYVVYKYLLWCKYIVLLCIFLSILEAQSIVSLNDDLNLASKTKEKKLIVFLKILAIEKW